MVPCSPPAIVWERHKPLHLTPSLPLSFLILMLSTAFPPNPLTPIWTPSQSLGNNPTWLDPFIKLRTNTRLLLSHNSYSCKIVYSFPPAPTSLKAIHKTCSILDSFITVSTWNDWREYIPRNTIQVWWFTLYIYPTLFQWRDSFIESAKKKKMIVIC